ncbi:MAG TPA: hypothetical protein VN915_06085 [Elusimicrobiota bacterium]|nr:hypothetical protein [Elusimicrobiota bacterium]
MVHHRKAAEYLLEYHEDLPRLKASGAHFAREFNSADDDAILDALDAATSA